MSKLSKRMREIRQKVEKRPYQLIEAFTLLKEVSAIKFDESVEISVRLGVDARKSDQQVRGATVLPHGTGKSVRVAVFAQGDNAKMAEEAGADIVGFEDLAEEIKAGKMDFDVVIASPDAMQVVGKLGQVLGPRGLMPNPKVGTVTADVATAIKNAKAGQVRYRTDKAGIIHCIIGRVSASAENLKDNFNAVIADLVKAKPSSAKGTYLKKITVSTTMGPGLTVDQSDFKV